MKKWIKVTMIIGLVLNLLGTLALARGLVLTDGQINQMSGTYFDENPYMADSLVSNRNWAYAGFGLIGVGFVLQLIAVIATP
jgi:hypothetical protein